MSKTSSSANTVKIVNGKLILSLPEAETPVVWQADLDHAQTALFTVKEDKKAKIFNLILQKSEGGIDKIAPFKTKKAAVDILMRTSDALQNVEAQKPSRKKASGADQGVDKLGAVLAFALVATLLLIWIISASRPNLDTTSNNTSISSNAPQGSSARDAAGVAVSADDFLSNR